MIYKSIILLLLSYIAMCSAVDWYHFMPYNSTTCAGSMYGLGYSIKGDNYCTSNHEGTTNYMTSIVSPANTSVKIQFYSSGTTPKACTTTTLSSTYTLNTCQDAQLQGFNMVPNGLWYTKNFYVNKTTTPYYPTSGGAQSNMLFSFYNIGCTSVTAYAYYVGYTTQNSPSDADVYYNYYCDGGTPYREYCEDGWGCDDPQDISQACISNYSFFLAKTVTCV